MRTAQTSSQLGFRKSDIINEIHMNTIMKTFGALALGILLILGGHVLGQPVPVQTTAVHETGAFNPTGGTTYTLQSSVGTTNTSVYLTSFREPVSNIPYTMSYLNSVIEYGTLDPTTSHSEFISFTGITQNANGSAILTGVTRGLGRSYPYTASTTLAQPHSGQSIFILSQSPQLFNEYTVARNNQGVTGLWSFTTSPYGSVPTSSVQLATKGYVDGVAVAGAPNSTESVKGIVELATQIEQASSTSLGSTGASIVLQAKYATSSPNGTPASLFTLILNNAGKIAQSAIDLTQAFTWTALHTFSGGLTSTGTTTVSAASLTTNPFVINGAVTKWPSANAVGTLTNNGSGTLTWGGTPRYTVSGASGISLIDTNTYATSSVSMIIPAGVTTASSTVVVQGNFQCNGDGNTGSCNIIISDGTGARFLTSTTLTPTTAHGLLGTFQATIFANNSTAAQKTQLLSTLVDTNTVSGTTVLNDLTTSSINMANQTTVVLVVRSGNVNTTASVSNVSYTVNP